jgi:cytochrome c
MNNQNDYYVKPTWGELRLVAAAVLGLVVGVFAALPILLAIDGIMAPLQPYLPGFVLIPLLGAIWLAIIWAINWMTGRPNLINFVTVFLFVLPWPSIVIAFMWQKSLDEQFGRRSDLRQRQQTHCTLPLTDAAIRGRTWAPTCKGCHDISPTELDLKNSSSGPNLQTAYMSLAGTTSVPQNPTRAYQHPYPPLAAARDAGVIWTDENLSAYLKDPKGFLVAVTGRSFAEPIMYMAFHIGEEGTRQDVIAYLKVIKDHPECD